MIANKTPESEGQSVLIVGRSDDSREVLRTLLERRGLRILEADRADAGLELARHHLPEVIVFDSDSEPRGEQQFRDCSQQSGASLVILASVRRPRATADSSRVVSKPYHYAPLLRKIEQLAKRRRVVRVA